jgi:hypothetical protein
MRSGAPARAKVVAVWRNRSLDRQKPVLEHVSGDESMVRVRRPLMTPPPTDP